MAQVAVCSQINTKHINTVWGRAYSCWMLNLLVHHVTGRLYKVKLCALPHTSVCIFIYVSSCVSHNKQGVFPIEHSLVCVCVWLRMCSLWGTDGVLCVMHFDFKQACVIGCAIAQAVSLCPVTAEDHIRFQWDMWWTKLHWNSFFSKYFAFPLSVSFHHCSIFISNYIQICVA